MDRKDLSGLLVAVILLGFLNSGTVRKRQDPIASAQTEAISYKQKLEEMKDGPKGAPSPSFKFYSKSNFLTESPMETAPDEEEELSGPSSGLEEELQSEGGIGDNEEDDWWAEDDEDLQSKPQEDGVESEEEAEDPWS